MLKMKLLHLMVLFLGVIVAGTLPTGTSAVKCYECQGITCANYLKRNDTISKDCDKGCRVSFIDGIAERGCGEYLNCFKEFGGCFDHVKNKDKIKSLQDCFNREDDVEGTGKELGGATSTLKEKGRSEETKQSWECTCEGDLCNGELYPKGFDPEPFHNGSGGNITDPTSGSASITPNVIFLTFGTVAFREGSHLFVKGHIPVFTILFMIGLFEMSSAVQCYDCSREDYCSSASFTEVAKLVDCKYGCEKHSELVKITRQCAKNPLEMDCILKEFGGCMESNNEEAVKKLQNCVEKTKSGWEEDGNTLDGGEAENTTAGVEEKEHEGEGEDEEQEGKKDDKEEASTEKKDIDDGNDVNGRRMFEYICVCKEKLCNGAIDPKTIKGQSNTGQGLFSNDNLLSGVVAIWTFVAVGCRIVKSELLKDNHFRCKMSKATFLHFFLVLLFIFAEILPDKVVNGLLCHTCGNESPKCQDKYKELFVNCSGVKYCERIVADGVVIMRGCDVKPVEDTDCVLDNYASGCYEQTLNQYNVEAKCKLPPDGRAGTSGAKSTQYCYCKTDLCNDNRNLPEPDPDSSLALNSSKTSLLFFLTLTFLWRFLQPHL